MATERIIHQHLPYSEAGQHKHTGMRSHMRGLDEAREKLRYWKEERITAHESGHEPTPIAELGLDQEVVIFPVPQVSDIINKGNYPLTAGKPSTK